MAWDSLPEDWTPAPVGRGAPVPKPTRVDRARKTQEKLSQPEARCNCGHPMSICAPENCSHPFAAAALWGD